MFFSQGDADLAVKLEFDDDGLGCEGGTGGTGENSVAKPKAPRVKKEKKEPGRVLNFNFSIKHVQFISFLRFTELKRPSSVANFLR